MNPSYPLVAARAGHRCEYCRAPEVIFNFPFEVELIVPSSRDGADDEANLALTCRACNLHKGSHLTALDDQTESFVRFFDPRHDQWNEHFQVATATGTMQGLTAIGRATVLRLRMNSEVQVAARRQWMRLGLYP